MSGRRLHPPRCQIVGKQAAQGVVVVDDRQALGMGLVRGRAVYRVGPLKTGDETR